MKPRCGCFCRAAWTRTCAMCCIACTLHVHQRCASVTHCAACRIQPPLHMLLYTAAHADRHCAKLCGTAVHCTALFCCVHLRRSHLGWGAGHMCMQKRIQESVLAAIAERQRLKAEEKAAKAAQKEAQKEAEKAEKERLRAEKAAAEAERKRTGKPKSEGSTKGSTNGNDPAAPKAPKKRAKPSGGCISYGCIPCACAIAAV